MPPKAKKAAGSPPLDGCVIAFSGTFTGYRQSDLEAKATALGGRPAKSVTAKTTHCVTTQSDFDKVCTKVWQAKDRGIFIVSLQWMLDSEQSNAKQDEAQYLFDNASQNGTTNGNGAAVPSSNPLPTQTAPAKSNSSVKRQASPGAVGSSHGPSAKKTKLDKVAQDSKAAAIGKEQIAKSWNVQVPVDEGCSLVGYGVHIDDDSVIWDASLNQTNAGQNNNKFYRIQVCIEQYHLGPRPWTDIL